MEQLFVLNASARAIWGAWKDGLGIEETGARLAEHFSIAPGAAVDDVRQALSAWCREGLIGARPGSALSSEAHNSATGCQQSEAPEVPRPVQQEWFSEHSYQLGLMPFAVRFGMPELEQAIHPALTHLVSDASAQSRLGFEVCSGTQGYELWQDSTLITSSENLTAFAMQVFREMIVAAIENVDSAMVLHAAAIAKGRECIVLPGQGGSGKSTLAAALAFSGYTLLGDDVIPLECETMRAVPIPMSLSLKQGSVPVLDALYGVSPRTIKCSLGDHQVHYLAPPGFDPAMLQRSYTVRKLVFPTYKSGSETVLRALIATDVLRGLMDSNSAITSPRHSDKTRKLLKWLESLDAYALSYGSLVQAVDAIASLFED